MPTFRDGFDRPRFGAAGLLLAGMLFSPKIGATPPSDPCKPMDADRHRSMVNTPGGDAETRTLLSWPRARFETFLCLRRDEQVRLAATAPYRTPVSGLRVEVALTLIRREGKVLTRPPYRRSSKGSEAGAYAAVTTRLVATLDALDRQPLFAAFVAQHRPPMLRIESSRDGAFEAVLLKDYRRLAIRLPSMAILQVDARHPDRVPDAPPEASSREVPFLTASAEAMLGYLQGSPEALAEVRSFVEAYDIGHVIMNFRKARFSQDMALYAERCCTEDHIAVRRKEGSWEVSSRSRSTGAEHLMPRVARIARARALRASQREGRGCPAPKVSHHRRRRHGEPQTNFVVRLTCPTEVVMYELSMTVTPPGTRMSHVVLGKPVFDKVQRR